MCSCNYIQGQALGSSRLCLRELGMMELEQLLVREKTRGQMLYLRTHKVSIASATWSNDEATLIQVSFPSQRPSHASWEHKEVSRGL